MQGCCMTKDTTVVSLIDYKRILARLFAIVGSVAGVLAVIVFIKTNEAMFKQTIDDIKKTLNGMIRNPSDSSIGSSDTNNNSVNEISNNPHRPSQDDTSTVGETSPDYEPRTLNPEPRTFSLSVDEPPSYVPNAIQQKRPGRFSPVLNTYAIGSAALPGRNNSPQNNPTKGRSGLSNQHLRPNDNKTKPNTSDPNVNFQIAEPKFIASTVKTLIPNAVVSAASTITESYSTSSQEILDQLKSLPRLKSSSADNLLKMDKASDELLVQELPPRSLSESPNKPHRRNLSIDTSLGSSSSNILIKRIKPIPRHKSIS